TRSVLFEQGKAVSSIEGRDDLMPVAAEHRPQQVADHPLVVYHQNRRHAQTPCRPGGESSTSRTLRASVSGVKGLGRKAAPGASRDSFRIPGSSSTNKIVSVP